MDIYNRAKFLKIRSSLLVTVLLGMALYSPLLACSISDETACNSQGFCTDFDYCICNDGFSGADCETGKNQKISLTLSQFTNLELPKAV